ncbi:MAG: flagellar filament capping protein FliD [Terriglobia bacterium]
MGASSISSLLSSLNTSATNESLAQLLGESSSSSTTSTASSATEAIQDAVDAILNSATNTSGSGIDVTSTVDAILELDAAPEETLDAQVAADNAETSALQSLQSDITAFQSSLESLTDFTGDFGALSVSSSNNDVVSATAANGTAAGTHTISVTNLATTSADYTASFSSATAELPTGSFELQVGTNAAVTVPVDSADGTNTLNGLASYINNQNLGVNATVITDSSGARLALESQTSGAAGQITLTDNTSADFSNKFTSASATLPSGSFDLKVGTNAAVMIPVDSGDGTNTLAGLASYINNQPNLGVTASVVTTASGASLALVPQSSGAAGVITISDDTTGSGNGMGFPNSYDPASPPAKNGMGFTDAVDGKDAALTVDGIPIDSASNTVTGVIPGVTLTLSGPSSTPVTLQISPDLTPIATDINNFVSSWNTLIQAVNAGIQTNGSTGAAGALSGDTSVDFVQQELLSALSSSMSGNNGVVNLQSIGIEMNDDGTLSVDSTTLNEALQNNFSAVQNLFQSTSGVGQALQTSLTSLTDPTTGPLNVDMNGISNEVTDLNSQISDFQAQLQQTQTQLTAEYSTINTTLEQMPETIAEINSQLNALNPSNSNS